MRSEFENLPEIEKIIKNGIHYNDRFNCYQSIDGISYLTIARLNGAWYAFQEQQKKIDEIKSIIDSVIPYEMDMDTMRKVGEIQELLK